MLFRHEFHRGLADGSITLTYRLWARPHVRVGGRYRTPIGALEVDAVHRVRLRDISTADARRAGFSDRRTLVAYLQKASRAKLGADSELYRVELHHAGANPESPPSFDAELSPEGIAKLAARLDRMDRLSRHGAWTARSLDLIGKHPRVAASRLAGKLGREVRTFKADVRKLKKLGLTLSFDVGYEISPRGRAFLAGWSSASGRPSGTAGAS